MWEKQYTSAVSSDVSERIDLAARQGESAGFLFGFSVPASGPYNLAGYEFTLAVRTSNGTLVLGVSSDIDAQITINAAGGTVSVNLAPADMDFPAGGYRYQLISRELPGGEGAEEKIKTWLSGVFTNRGANAIGPVNNNPEFGKSIIRVAGQTIAITVSNS